MKRYPKHLFIGTHSPYRRIAEYLAIIKNVPEALAKITRKVGDKGVNILSGNFSTRAESPLGYWSFFADLTDANMEPETLAKELRKLDIVEEVLCNAGTLDGLLMDTLQFPLVVMEKRSITMRAETFGMFTQGLYGKFETGAKRLLFAFGMDSGRRKVKAVMEEHGLRGIDVVNVIMAERVAKGWGIPSIKRFDPSGQVEIEVAELFECSPFKGKTKESMSYFFRGYLSGVVSGALGKEVAIKEERCIAKGDETCYFVVSPEEKGVIGEELKALEPMVENSKIRNELFTDFTQIFGRDIKFLVLKFLSSKEVASIREIAKKVGMSPKNLSKYLDYLADRGAIEVVYRGKNIRLYRIAQKAGTLKRYMKNKL